MSGERLAGPRLLADPLGTALIAVVRERGLEDTRLEQVLERAGVERPRFEAEFEDLDDLVARLFEAIAADFRARVGAAFGSAQTWPDSLRAAAWEMARWILDNPGAIWFGMVGVLGAPEMVLVRREELFLWCASLVEAGREAAPDPARVPQGAALPAVGAIVEMLRRREDGSLPAGVLESVPAMMYGAVRPYLGEEAARAELSITPPADLAARGG